MKYDPKLYAKAFAELAAGPLTAEEERRLTQNLVALMKKNGDLHRAHRTLELIEEELRKKSGRRKIVIQTARPFAEAEQLITRALEKPGDIVKTELHPELVAGARIIINDDLEYDASLKHKLDALFNT